MMFFGKLLSLLCLLPAFNALAIHRDILTSTSIQTDKNGNQIQNYEYSAFGQSRYTQNTNVFKASRRYTGQMLDNGTGLYYFGGAKGRYYIPELGRFGQPDNIIPDLFNPQSYNRYSYCGNNPLRYTDPSGHGAIGDALFSQETYTSSYKLLTMHDSPGWRAVEVPVAIGGMVIATADTVLNFVSLGGKTALEGGAKGVIKAGLEAGGKVEGEKAGAKIVKDVPNPFGKKGGLEHQAKVNEVANDVKSRGLEARKEGKIETPGGNKDTRYADVVGKDAQGNVVEIHQVGRQTQGGLPVSRERQAIQDIKNATGQTPQFHPYNTPPPPAQP